MLSADTLRFRPGNVAAPPIYFPANAKLWCTECETNSANKPFSPAWIRRGSTFVKPKGCVRSNGSTWVWSSGRTGVLVPVIPRNMAQIISRNCSLGISLNLFYLFIFHSSPHQTLDFSEWWNPLAKPKSKWNIVNSLHQHSLAHTSWRLEMN